MQSLDSFQYDIVPAPVLSAAPWISEICDEFERREMAAPSILTNPARRDLAEARLHAIYDYWADLPQIAGAAVCADPVDAIIDALGRASADLMVLEPLNEGENFLYLHYGAQIAWRVGRDYTGLKVSDIMTHPVMPRLFATCYRTAMTERISILTDHATAMHTEVDWWRRIVLPLCNSTGKVTRLIAGNVAYPEVRGFR